MSRRIRTLALGASLALALGSTPVVAQDTGGGTDAPSLCDLLTAAEIEAAVGIAPADDPRAGEAGCYWSFAAPADELLGLDLVIGPTLGEHVPEGYTPVDLGGVRGHQSADGGTLGIEGPDRRLTLYFFSTVPDMDVRGVVAELAAAVAPRFGTFEPIEPDVPDMASQGDPELAALFPTTVLDRTIEVTTNDARDLDEAGRANLEAVFGAALAAQGRRVEDFALGQAPFWDATGEEYGLIGAFRVRGGDAAQLIEPLLALIANQGGIAVEDIEQVELRLADRDVIRWTVTNAQGSPEDSWVYPAGETVWLITGGPPERVEAILAQLP